MAVILVPVVLITIFFTRPTETPVRVVDYQPILARARAQAPFEVLAPQNLPATWRPTVAQWTRQGEPYLDEAASIRNRWKLGYLAPEDVYVEVTQGDVQPQQFVGDVTRDGVPDGASTVAGRSWERRVSPDERTRSLVLGGPTVTTVVVGDSPYEALEAFAATLSAS